MSFSLLVAAAVVIFVVAQAREEYGPWPGARPADNPPPLRSRPRDYRDVELRPALPESRLPSRPVGAAGPTEGDGAAAPGASPLGTAPDYAALACGVSDVADPVPPMRIGLVPLKAEIVDIFSPNVPAFEGKARLSSACAVDDTATIAALLTGSSGPAGWTPGPAGRDDPSSRGRNVTGLLRGVELSA